jgi:prephenate dehydrogenase
MAENKLQITIVGLGMIGASAGLALRRFQEKVTIVGHDPNPARAGKAKQMGAVERTEWNLINAVRKADRVLLALPASEIRPTLDAIKEDLKPGCVLLDTADVKEPVLKWAAELLPENVHFIGGHPIVLAQSVETADARADLFDKKLFCLIPSERASEQALNLAIDLATAMGAQPFFLDVLEHDGMAAVVDHLPIMMAGALMALANGSSGWKDMRKLAGSQFYASTWVAEGDAKGAAGACIANKDHLVRLIDTLMGELEQWQAQIAAGNEDALAQKFETGMNATHAWVRAQADGNWEEQAPVSDLPTSGAYMRQMIGLGGRDRAPKPRK